MNGQKKAIILNNLSYVAFLLINTKFLDNIFYHEIIIPTPDRQPIAFSIFNKKEESDSL